MRISGCTAVTVLVVGLTCALAAPPSSPNASPALIAAAWRSHERQRPDPAGTRSPRSERPTGATRAKSGEPPPAESHAVSIAAGASLFSGKTRFAHRGPACIACHSAAGLPFPNGGTLGPNLTTAYTRMGAQGVATALNTLYFPAMYPLYRTRPLTAQEQTDLAAFLQYSSTQPARDTTLPVLGVALVLFVIFMLIVAFSGRNRLQNVRLTLVANARHDFRLRPPATLPDAPDPGLEPPHDPIDGSAGDNA